ncbi:MAG: glutamine--tRNA ligase/YqeY domain fusion protein [Clostridia bacterium]
MEELKAAKNFIEEFIEEDMRTKQNRITTRFPPEPNGYLHIGHAKALCIDFGMAKKYGGTCNLRFDDTNPTKEDAEYVEAIKYDINWLGFEWAELKFGSDYFGQCYELAVKLIKKGVAYVDDLSKDDMREYRGTLTEAGKESPFRSRSVDENLELFSRMKAGEFADGSRTLRAKIDMASPNINMRDPALYRILHMAHHQTGDKWCIYPMYDFAHPIQDAIEGITHSLCSLEYEAHRPLYDWVVEQCEFENKPRQIEFARLNLTNTIMSKRYLRRLVEEGYVSGWDDPRMPTLCGMRRRGYTPEAIRDFLARVGVSKADSTVDTAMLEHCVREDLNASAYRMMAVISPIRLVVTNWEAGRYEDVEIENLPGGEAGAHSVRFGRELYIEREDFAIDPPGKFFRLKPGGEVRLKGAYIVKCENYDVDEAGLVTTIYCTYDPATKSGECERKVKGTLHWLPDNAVPAEFRLYEPLMLTATDEDADKDFTQLMNPDSLQIKHGFVENELAKAAPGDRFQFMRVGYFAADIDHTAEKPVFNRTVGLKDSFKM